MEGESYIVAVVEYFYLSQSQNNKFMNFDEINATACPYF